MAQIAPPSRLPYKPPPAATEQLFLLTAAYNLAESCGSIASAVIPRQEFSGAPGWAGFQLIPPSLLFVSPSGPAAYKTPGVRGSMAQRFVACNGVQLAP